ncbi:MAG: rod shape-determining protein MreC, partial [Gammaproteobacteria bacterium]
LKKLLGYLEKTSKKEFIYGEIEEINYAPKPSLTVGVDRSQKADQMVAFNWTGLIGSVELSAGSKVEIKPIFAEDSQIPIRNRRTNSNMILVGTDTPQNFLIKGLKKNEDIVPGDKLVTSGLGKKYPKGIDVGIVHKISATSNNEFLEIEVLGTSEFSSGDQILLTLP